MEGASTDEVSLLLRHKDFSMIGQNTATGSRYVIFSTTGATIPTGTGAAVLALSLINRTCRHTLCRHYRP